jgi:hypothetical protein
VYVSLHQARRESYAGPSNPHKDDAPVGTDHRRSTFEKIFETNAWTNQESVSGYGSTFYYTVPIRKALPKLFEELGVNVFLDAPCGDFNWMQHVKLPDRTKYIGCDIVSTLIDRLVSEHAAPNRSFRVLDIVDGPIPKSDLWLCRDAIFHLSFKDGVKVLENAARSGCEYFACTTYDHIAENDEIQTGTFRPINLMMAPYDLPRPIRKIDDFMPLSPPRCLAVWSRAQLEQRFGGAMNC